MVGGTISVHLHCYRGACTLKENVLCIINMLVSTIISSIAGSTVIIDIVSAVIAVVDSIGIVSKKSIRMIIVIIKVIFPTVVFLKREGFCRFKPPQDGTIES